MNEEQLSALFEAEMKSIFERERELGLCSTRFIEGIREYGGLAYARRLLKKAESELPRNTFGYLRRQGRLDLSMEYYVVQERFRPLFTQDEVSIAQYRLKHGD